MPFLTIGAGVFALIVGLRASMTIRLLPGLLPGDFLRADRVRAACCPRGAEPACSNFQGIRSKIRKKKGQDF